MATMVGVVLLLGLLLGAETAPLNCYIDVDIAAGQGTDDGKALCSQITSYWDMTSSKNITCEEGTHSCISLVYDGASTGGGCVPTAYQGMACDIFKGMDKRIDECRYCTSNLCNTCADGAAPALTMSVGMLVSTVGILCMLLA